MVIPDKLDSLLYRTLGLHQHPGALHLCIVIIVNVLQVSKPYD